MTEQEKNDVKKLAAAVEALPSDKKNYILGYAEGLADALADRGIAEAVRDALDDTVK